MLRASLNYCCSSKEKVVANALRALGYFLGEIDLGFFSEKVIPFINAQQLQGNQSSKNWDPRLLTVHGKLCMVAAFRTVLIMQLSNKSPKITWNAAIAISKVLTNAKANYPELDFIKVLTSNETSSRIYDILATR